MDRNRSEAEQYLAVVRSQLSPAAVATIAANSVRQAYGVVGLAGKNATDQLIREIKQMKKGTWYFVPRRTK